MSKLQSMQFCKKGPLSIVNSVAMYEAQLTTKQLSVAQYGEFGRPAGTQANFFTLVQNSQTDRLS